MLPKKLEQGLAENLSSRYKHPVALLSSYSVSGGCINQTEKITTSEGVFFLKWNDAFKYPGMFEAEAKGLKLLKNTGEIFIPEVISSSLVDKYSFLLLEFVDQAGKIKNFWEDFGISLARLHKHSSDYFGLDHDNYIGSLPQSNQKHSDWISFFIEERLEKQIRLARDAGKISVNSVSRFEHLFKVLPEIFPEESLALLHGDLWNGNFMISPQGKACIFDPAVYFGHREMDLAMSKLFGGFSPVFYEAYQQQYPLEKGWQNRLDICNLYPLMVHVNLFGESYINSVESILHKF